MVQWARVSLILVSGTLLFSCGNDHQASTRTPTPTLVPTVAIPTATETPPARASCTFTASPTHSPLVSSTPSSTPTPEEHPFPGCCELLQGGCYDSRDGGTCFSRMFFTNSACNQTTGECGPVPTPTVTPTQACGASIKSHGTP